MSDFRDVGDFHAKFGLDHVVCNRDNTCASPGPGPRAVSSELLEFRLKFLLEELLEFAEAHNYVLGYNPYSSKFEFKLPGPNAAAEPVDHAKAFDALIDLNYVSHGTAHLFGYPWQEGWNQVHQANMEKERCQRSEDSTRGSAYDVIKPKGWRPPDIKSVLRRFGWNV